MTCYVCASPTCLDECQPKVKGFKMNERIRKIAIETDAWCDQHYTDDPMYDIKWEQKFAELIVRECAGLFEIEWGEEKLTGNDVGYVVKKHFGVE